MTEKQFIKNIIIKNFRCSDYFFESAWKYVVSSKELKFVPAVSGPTPLLHRKITVDKQTKVVKLIATFLKMFQKISAKDEFKQIAAVFGDICREYKTDEDVKMKALEEIRSDMNDIRKILQSRSGHIKLCDLEYKERIDLRDENYQYNLLGLEIDYVDREPLVYFKLFSSDGKLKYRKLIPEFSKSEKSFAFLLRLAAAVKFESEPKPGRRFPSWVHINEEDDKGRCLYTQYQGIEEFRDFLARRNLFNLDKKDKRGLVRTKKRLGVVRLAIPEKNIQIEIKHLKSFASQFADAKGENYEKGRNRICKLINDSLKTYTEYLSFSP